MSSTAIRVSRGLVLVLMAGLLAIPVMAASIKGKGNTQPTYVYKPDETIFTGTVVTNDLVGKTITVNGHNPMRRELVEQHVAGGVQARSAEKAFPAADEPQAFQVDGSCRVSLTNRLTAHLSDVQHGALVDVVCRKVVESGVTNAGVTNWIAVAIQSAGRHPYDSAPAPNAVLQKK